MAIPKVMRPNLPTNIRKTSKLLPKLDSSDVIPKLRPMVLRAEMASNRMEKKG